VVALEMKFLDVILRHFFAKYDRVVEEGFPLIQKEYHNKLTLLGHEVCVDTGLETLSGTFLRVNSAGHLVLGLPDTSVREISIGDVK